MTRKKWSYSRLTESDGNSADRFAKNEQFDANYSRAIQGTKKETQGNLGIYCIESDRFSHNQPSQGQNTCITKNIAADGTGSRHKFSRRFKRNVEYPGKTSRSLSNRRVKFTSNEYEIVYQWKEEEKLPWAKIFQRYNRRFPGRTQKSLQSCYYRRKKKPVHRLRCYDEPSEDTDCLVKRMLAD
ncbi:hypothetical protein V8C42DRAFT_338544 [Trichoderma barbatum]